MSWSRVQVGCNLREEISVKVGVHQCSCWAPCYSSQYRSPLPRVSYWITGGTAIETDPLKFSMEGKGLRVSMLHGRETIGEDRGGGYPWGSTPLSLHNFFHFALAPFFPSNFSGTLRQKLRFFPKPIWPQPPAHFSSKAPPTNPQAPVLHVLPYKTCAPTRWLWWHVHVECCDS